MLDPVEDSDRPPGFADGLFEHYRSVSLLLSGQKDQPALAEALGAAFVNLPLALRTVLYQVRSQGPCADSAAGPWQLDPVPRRETGIGAVAADSIAGVAACLQRAEPVELVLDNGATRRVQPIRNHLPVGFVAVLDGFAATPAARAFLDDLAELVGNLNQLHAQSERDGLTGLYNRQVFDRRLHKIQNDLEHAFRRRSDPDLSCYLALLDLDHFKRVNDSHGHVYGDAVLVGMARLMERSFRHTDELFRYGGEEFAVILRKVAEHEAHRALERFRERVRINRFPHAGELTLSIGYCRLEPGSPLEMIARADRALYYCKEHGRNRVAGYGEVMADNPAGEE